MAVLAIVDDLIFQSKLREAAARAGARLVFADVGRVPESAAPGAAWDLVIVDLGLAWTDPVALTAMIRRDLPQTPIVGYCSHVDVELQGRARTAGCSEVLPRSTFVERLPGLLGAGREEREPS